MSRGATGDGLETAHLHFIWLRGKSPPAPPPSASPPKHDASLLAVHLRYTPHEESGTDGAAFFYPRASRCPQGQPGEDPLACPRFHLHCPQKPISCKRGEQVRDYTRRTLGTFSVHPTLTPLFPHLRQTGLPPAPKNQGTCAKSGINHVLWVPPTDLWKQKRGLRSRKGDDGQEKPVKSCLALHEMDLKPCGGNDYFRGKFYDS